jgi:putative transposase
MSTAALCRALQVPRSAVYRRRQPTPERAPRPPSSRALTVAEQATVRDTLNSPRFQDQAPRQVYATLLDEGTYLCSWSTMYRILRRHDEVRERRNQLRHPAYTKPELLATTPRQLWSWDITKLKGAQPWTYYYLYVIMDVFSRYVVGWMVMEREAASLAEALIADTCAKEGISVDQLTLHADRGSSMSSKTVAQLLADLGVTKTHSRPHVANDNPYSEAQFKTLKYRPDYPQTFGSVEDARTWTRAFVAWYNHKHHHSALGLLTPAVVHHGLAADVRNKRREVLGAAQAAHPERFVRGAPRVPDVPRAVWINPPQATGDNRPARPSSGYGSAQLP